ncbi:hypothetical protein NU08_1575 [Flavobacterium anhuiense]|uniref:Uncharacterized protein n=1 Tax=Flavobacterium anhuiense TaxID=459526 RepID=A0A444W082_9FLAO|nr:hypothetical protein NU08_1575 [Flavobacterium anhuiense]
MHTVPPLEDKLREKLCDLAPLWQKKSRTLRLKTRTNIGVWSR